MLILIIFGSIFAGGVALFAISMLFKKLGKKAFSEFIGIVTMVFGGFGALVCTVIICYSRSDSYKNKITTQIKSLNSRYDALVNQEDTTIQAKKDKLIKEYNKDVATFKARVETANEHIHSPWLNWFVCPEYSTITDDMVQYINI